MIFKKITQKLKKTFFPPRLKGSNQLVNNGFINKVKFDVIIGENNNIKLALGSSIENATIYIRGNNNSLIINENVKFKSGILRFEDNHNVIEIGKNTTIESAQIAVIENNQSIKIGNDCLISNDISIRNGDSHSIIDSITGKRINYSKSILIGDHVWLGANVTILKGVHIQSNVIVGLGSVVTSDLESNCIYGGIPAKKIKSNTNWDRNRLT